MPNYRAISPQEFRKLLGPTFNASGRKAIAVSGGMDSIALAALLKEQVGHQNHGLFAFTVDHKLRRCSSSEAQAVHRDFEKLGVQHEILDIDQLPSTGLENNARRSRYAALTRRCLEYGIEELYLGHHSGDQAETILMRLIQGSRWRGLAGMQSIAGNPLSKCVYNAHTVKLRRPLLEIPKARLLATCEEKGLRWYDDMSNDDISLTLRNAIRHIFKCDSRLPCSLRPDSLISLSQAMRGGVSKEQEILRDLFRRSGIVLQRATGAIDFSIQPLIDAKISDDVKIAFLEHIANIITPVKNLDRNSLKTILDTLYRQKDGLRASKATASGLLWCASGKRCHVGRQPLNKSDGQTFSVSQCTTNSWLLYDNRFWLKICDYEQPIAIRALREYDMSYLRSKALDQGKSDTLADLLSLVKGHERFTLPVAVDLKTDKVLALPSADFAIDENVQIVCRINGEHLWEKLAY